MIQASSEAASAKGHSARWMLAIYIALILSILVMQWFSDDMGDIAVVANPWGPASAAADDVIAAGGRVSGVGRWPFVVLARPGSVNPHLFTERLRRAGALFTFRPGVIAGCFAKV